MDTKELAAKITDILDSKKGIDIETIDLTGKTVIPFATSNSSGIGSSDKALQALTGDSVEWLKGEGVRKGASEEDIRRWAESLIPEE